MAIWQPYGEPLATDLVKLVNKTHPLICQYQSASLQCPLSGDGTTLHVRCQTHSRSALTGSEYWTWSYLLYILEKLWFSCSWVSTEKNINISSHLVLLTLSVNRFTPMTRVHWQPISSKTTLYHLCLPGSFGSPPKRAKARARFTSSWP